MLALILLGAVNKPLTSTSRPVSSRLLSPMASSTVGCTVDTVIVPRAAVTEVSTSGWSTSGTVTARLRVPSVMEIAGTTTEGIAAISTESSTALIQYLK